jgi:hypothetical protein
VVKGWLLDTNVVSELRKPRADPRVKAFIAAQPLDSLFLSAVTMAEIRQGIETAPDALLRAELATWLQNSLRGAFAGRVLPTCEDVLARWLLIVWRGRKRNETYQAPDILIAATASYHGLVVVSRDAKPFEKAGVSVFNPWRDATPT